MKTRNHVVVFVFLSAIIVAIALPALAYDYPLSAEAVREAYMLGKSDSAKRDEFFAKYTQHPPLPKTGPYVEMIQLETPFAVVVEHTAQKLNYYAPDAAEEFGASPAFFACMWKLTLPSPMERSFLPKPVTCASGPTISGAISKFV